LLQRGVKQRNETLYLGAAEGEQRLKRESGQRNQLPQKGGKQARDEGKMRNGEWNQSIEPCEKKGSEGKWKEEDWAGWGGAAITCAVFTKQTEENWLRPEMEVNGSMASAIVWIQVNAEKQNDDRQSPYPCTGPEMDRKEGPQRGLRALGKGR